MPRRTNTISVIQFDDRVISLLRVRRTGQGIHVLAHEVESASDGSAADALAAFVERHGVAGDTVYTVLARHDMTARILTLPSQDADEVASMVRLSAEEYVPYPLEELVIDQCILERLDDGQSRVMAVFAHRDIVESHVVAVRAAGLEPEQIYVSSACLASAALAAAGRSEGRFALVNLASGGLEVIAMHGSSVEYDRGVALAHGSGTYDATDPGVIAELGVEIRASLAAYRRESEDGLGVDRVYVCSEWTGAEETTSLLADEIGYECVPADFARSLVTKGAEHIEALALTSLGAALAAQGRAAVPISLVPESVARERSRVTGRRATLRVGGLVALILVALVGLYGQAIHQRNAYIAQLETRVAAVKPIAETVERRKRRLMRLEQHVDRSGTVLELLARFCELMPESGINIIRFDFSHGEGITIEGRAEGGGYASQLAEDLREAGGTDTPWFTRAHEGDFEQVEEQGQPVVRYAIKIPFPEEDKASADSEQNRAFEYEHEFGE